MFKRLKTFTLRMIAGGNVATILLMVLTGYADCINPSSHPFLSCLGLLFPIFLVVNLLFLFFWLAFKLRYTLIPVAGFLLVYPSIRVYIPINMQEDAPDKAIKVLSYNVQAFTGIPRYQGAFDIVFDYLKEADADIVCLQEDGDSWGVKRSRLDSLYAYNERTRIGDKVVNAVGIYSRYPIVNVEHIPYASKGNGSVAYYLHIDGDTVIVINNHFESNHFSLDDRKRYKEMLKGHVDKDSAETRSKMIFAKLADAAKTRAPQADSVLSYIERHKRYPIIVCGDFNDNPISYTRRTIAKSLTDCYVESGNGIGLSYNQKGFFVRIDNIMCSSHFEPYNCKVDKKIDASDHYPILCWLKKTDNSGKKDEK